VTPAPPDRAALARIARAVFPGARRGLGPRLVRMFALVQSLQDNGEPATVARIAALRGVTETAVKRLTRGLVDRGVVEERLAVAGTDKATRLKELLKQQAGS
jgi:IclR helix-turn-helix domain